MNTKFLKLYSAWQKRKYSQNQRNISLFFEGIFFIVVLPYLFYKASIRLDLVFALPGIFSYPFNIYLGLPILLIGFSFSFWPVWTQYKMGLGTPVPMMPTQKLIVQGPYKYSRNPMGFGFAVGLLGVGIIIHSFSSLLLAIAISLVLFSYYKFIEEKELVLRFGKEYIKYKKKVPFLIPKLTK